ncbi:MAG TPA: diguanylate cyclase [Gaiellaceae bacterium]|jgi:diguanylate cyclase (GGDEF)-like protein/putative nucleotidyltransferase with HDIG domain
MPPRLRAVVLPVEVVGLVVAAAAAASFAVSPRDAATLAGIAGLLAASTLAERYPVPLDGIDTGGVSLGFVFCTAAIVLYGWEAGVVVGFAAPIMQLLEHRPPIRVAYNAAVLSLAAVFAGAAVEPLRGHEAALVFAQVAVAALAHFGVNLALISLVVSVSARKPFLAVARTSIQFTALPFALMASAALMLVVLWQRSPFLSAALVGPLLAIALYQRSTFRELRAMRLALTDPLTGLGNHRHFHERLEHELADSRSQAYPLSLCLIDVDDFKKINDRFGHPGGDKVLAQLATNLRQGGEAFRLGGDEFAILLPGRDEEGARVAAQAIVERMATLDLQPAGLVTVSAGIATVPKGEIGRDELVRRSDSALYWAKEYGKNQVRIYRPDVVEIAELKRLAAGPDRAARFRAAASLAKAVDARDAYTGSHSERVADLAARIATRLGVDREGVELTRLAASLHDLGKLAIPEEILRKPGPLSETERLVLERHPQIGFRMLESLGVNPVAEWVLRHHERWDGSGYPDGIGGEEIPLGARIIFVADAYDAMISDRVYRSRLTDDEAIAELARCSGTQFDPEVVVALADELGVGSIWTSAVSA